jgi:hypothetical protein
MRVRELGGEGIEDMDVESDLARLTSHGAS